MRKAVLGAYGHSSVPDRSMQTLISLHRPFTELLDIVEYLEYLDQTGWLICSFTVPYIS